MPGQRQRRGIVSSQASWQPETRAASALAGLVNTSRPALLRSASASSSSASDARSMRSLGSTVCKAARPAARYRDNPNSSGTRSRGSSTATRPAVLSAADPHTVPPRQPARPCAPRSRRPRPAPGRRGRRRQRSARQAARPRAAPHWRARSARRPRHLASRPGWSRRSQRSPAGHPDHRAGTVTTAQQVQFALVGRGSDGTHLCAGHRCGPQQGTPVGSDQAFGVLEIDRPGDVHGPAFACALWAAISALT